jgi:hypothetical protein
MKPCYLFFILLILVACDAWKMNNKSKFSKLEASLTTESATFKFSYAGNMETYHIDLSTYADMSWDVYLSFAKGAASPLTETDPAKWDKYVAGKKLYWRVTNFERTIQSPIMEVIVRKK